MDAQLELKTAPRGYYTRIAKACDYSRQHVSKVLRGQGSYSKESLARIAAACGVDVGWLARYIECDPPRP